MEDQGNLFAVPNRPVGLTIRLERLWVAGDDVVEITETTRGSKTSEPVWSGATTYTGPHWELVARAHVEAAIARWSGSLWAKQPKPTSYEGWKQHYGI